MKNSRFAEEQIVKMLREADRTSVAAVSKATEVSEQSIYTWRKKYGGMAVDEVLRLRQLEQENARLKEVLAERVRCSMSHAQHCTSAAAWRRRMSPRWSRCGRCLRSSRATAIDEYRFSCNAQVSNAVQFAHTAWGQRRACKSHVCGHAYASPAPDHAHRRPRWPIKCGRMILSLVPVPMASSSNV